MKTHYFRITVLFFVNMKETNNFYAAGSSTYCHEPEMILEI